VSGRPPSYIMHDIETRLTNFNCLSSSEPSVDHAAGKSSDRGYGQLWNRLPRFRSKQTGKTQMNIPKSTYSEIQRYSPITYWKMFRQIYIWEFVCDVHASEQSTQIA